jgi:hypothetical protein
MIIQTYYRNPLKRAIVETVVAWSIMDLYGRKILIKTLYLHFIIVHAILFDSVAT